MNRNGSFLPQLLDSVFVCSFQCMFLYGVSSYGFSMQFLETAPASIFLESNGWNPLQDTALDLHNELLLWYVCEDAEASVFLWFSGCGVQTSCRKTATIHGCFFVDGVRLADSVTTPLVFLSRTTSELDKKRWTHEHLAHRGRPVANRVKPHDHQLFIIEWPSPLFIKI